MFQITLEYFIFKTGFISETKYCCDMVLYCFRCDRESHNSFQRMDDLDFTFDTGVDMDTHQHKTVVCDVFEVSL